MSGRLTVDLLIDRLMSTGVPSARGARMARYDSSADRTELATLIDAHMHAWRSFPFQDHGDRARLARNIAERAARRHGLSPAAPLNDSLADVALRLISTEPAYFPFSLGIDISTLTPLQLSEASRDLCHRLRFLTDQSTRDTASDTIEQLLAGLLGAMPSGLAAFEKTAAPSLSTDLLSLVGNPLDAMTSLLAHFISNDDVQDRGLYHPLCRQLYRNILTASGVVVDPDQPLLSQDIDKPTLPLHCTKEPVGEVAARYFANTPLLALLTAPVPFAFPEEARFEHTHIIAGTGHGKTQTLQHLIVADLQRSPDQVPSMVILDSQGDMIGNLQRLAIFDPAVKGSLARRLLIVDPSDVDFAPALNLRNPAPSGR